MTSLVSVKNVTLTYGARPAVKDVSFDIQKGENLCLIGPNGSGKSTLIKGVLRLMKPVLGEITRTPGLRVAYLAQAHTFEHDFPATVQEIVLSGTVDGGSRFFYTAKDRAKAREALELVQITDLAKQRIGDLSGGQRQRAMLARALAHNPELLIMDEPCSALDPVITRDLYALFDLLKREKGLTLFISTHDWDYVHASADRVLVINRTLRYLGPSDEFTEEVGEEAFCHG